MDASAGVLCYTASQVKSLAMIVAQTEMFDGRRAQAECMLLRLKKCSSPVLDDSM